MYRIDTGCKSINGQRVDTFIRGIAGRKTLLEVEAGTNGYHGDDSRVYFRLTDLNKADFYSRVKINEAGRPVAVEICLDGSEGVDAALKVLDFARRVLTDQLTGKAG